MNKLKQNMQNANNHLINNVRNTKRRDAKIPKTM